MPRAFQVLSVLLLIFVPLFAAPRRRVARSAETEIPLDARRSFVITDQAILDAFSFERTMTALVAGTTTSPLGLFQQWWDTQNAKPGLTSAENPHCDDFLSDGKPSFNGFVRRCPTTEGQLATSDPFATTDFVPLAISNRFDLAAADGANCGQFRVVYARAQSSSHSRLHVIFEAVLPNPAPDRGLAGCRAVAQFWADLSAVDSISERRAKLESFFYSGLPGFAPVISLSNYSTPGGVRSLQVSAKESVRFYQFRLVRSCTPEGHCRAVMQPDTLENTPMGKLFDASVDTPQAARFREELLRQVPNLAAPDVNLFFVETPREFLMAESNPSDQEFLFNYIGSYTAGAKTAAGKEFDTRLLAELQRIGSPLAPSDLVTRFEVQSCVGCHFFADATPIGGGLKFEGGVDFQHVTESRENGEGGPNSRFALSHGLQERFIPHRMEILRDFLRSGKPPVHSN